MARENQADWKILAARENQADWKILAARENQADWKIFAGTENQADWEILASTESQANWEILAGVAISASSEILAEQEMQAACLLFRLREISNCWLLPGLADEHVLFLVDVMNLACSLQVKRRLRLPCFYGRPSPVLFRLFVPARHAKKWLKSMQQPKVWLPPGIPLISVKSQNS